MAAKLPDVLDKVRLLVVEVLNMKTLQLVQVVAPHVAKDWPAPMNEKTYGPTITLIAPP